MLRTKKKKALSKRVMQSTTILPPLMSLNLPEIWFCLYEKLFFCASPSLYSILRKDNIFCHQHGMNSWVDGDEGLISMFCNALKAIWLRLCYILYKFSQKENFKCYVICERPKRMMLGEWLFLEGKWRISENKSWII